MLGFFAMRRLKKLGVVTATCFALALTAWFCLPLVPLPQGLFAPPPAQSELVDVNGESLRMMREANEPFDRPVAYAEIPQALIHATLAAEDKRFWQHPGVDWRASLR